MASLAHWWFRRISGTDAPVLDVHTMRLAAQVKSVQVHRLSFEQMYSYSVRAVFNSAGADFAEEFLKSGDVSSQVVLDKFAAPMGEIYHSLFATVAKDFGGLAWNQLSLTGIWEPATSVPLTNWTKEHIRNRVRSLIDNTKETIRKTVLEGDAAKLEKNEIARNIRSRFSNSQARALVLLRTEVTAASNSAMHFAVLSRVGSVNKIWATASVDRSRPTHQTANGQKKSILAPYIVGNSQMLFPGDTSLGAALKEVIQCNCAQIYSPIGS